MGRGKTLPYTFSSPESKTLLTSRASTRRPWYQAGPPVYCVEGSRTHRQLDLQRLQHAKDATVNVGLKNAIKLNLGFGVYLKGQSW